MSHGLRVWRQDGSLRLDISSRLTRVVQIGAISLQTSGSEVVHQFVSVPGMLNNGNWYVAISGGYLENNLGGSDMVGKSSPIISTGGFTYTYFTFPWIASISYTVVTL